MTGLLHVMSRADWAEARHAGRVACPDGGFIHLCDAGQLAFVLERHFAGRTGLVVLRIDPAGLDVRHEVSEPGMAPFAHLYEALPVGAVTGTEPVSGPLRLIDPDRDHLAEYVAALEAGWSPSTTRDLSGLQLEAIAADADQFLDGLRHCERRVIQPGDDSVLPLLPGRVFWLWDGSFCGAINIRYVPGSVELPDHVSGHVGYSVIPNKRGRGYATRALAMVLPVVRDLPLARMQITCDETNIASRRVIEANGGVVADRLPNPDRPGTTKLLFWIELEGRSG